MFRTLVGYRTFQMSQFGDTYTDAIHPQTVYFTSQPSFTIFKLILNLTSTEQLFGKTHNYGNA